MTLTNSIVAKLSVALVAIAMAFALVAPAAQAEDVSSMSLEELIALVNQLQSQLAGDSSSAAHTGTCSYVWTRSLSQGSTGQDVMDLQKFLNSDPDTVVALSGAGSIGMETSYYGALTAAAVSKFQTKYSAAILVPVGLVSPTGYFGPSSMAKANSLCKSMGSDTDGDGDGDGDDSGDLEGGAGSISDADYVAGLSSEEVGEEVEDVEVAGLEIEADEGSDIELTAVNLNFSKSTGATANFDKYADEVSVWVDGEEVARVDADEFDKGNGYDKTISLDGGGIIRAGEVGDLVVAVSGISNLDSSDAGDTWTVEFESVRFKDAQGASVTDSSTGDINDGSGKSFTFENFATATDLELKVTSGDDDINDAHVIGVDVTNDTDGVELFAFNLEVEGDSDVLIDILPITLTSTTGGIGEIINTFRLYADGELIGSEATSTTDTSGEQVFDNLDWTLVAGEEVEMVLKGDANDIGTGAFDEGSTLSAAFGETEMDLSASHFDAVDENGDDLADADETGSASSDANLFFSIAPQVDVTSTSIVANDNGTAPAESATAKIVMSITAVGGTLYLNGDDESTVGKEFWLGQIYGSGTSAASTTASTTTFTVTGGTNDPTNSGADNEYFTLDEGESMTMSVEAIVTQSTYSPTAVLAGLKAQAIQFGTSSTSDTTRAAFALTYTDLLDATQSGTASLVNAS